jgi:hypothetical protein
MEPPLIFILIWQIPKVLLRKAAERSAKHLKSWAMPLLLVLVSVELTLHIIYQQHWLRNLVSVKACNCCAKDLQTMLGIQSCVDAHIPLVS